MKEEAPDVPVVVRVIGFCKLSEAIETAPVKPPIERTPVLAQVPVVVIVPPDSPVPQVTEVTVPNPGVVVATT